MISSYLPFVCSLALLRVNGVQGYANGGANVDSVCPTLTPGHGFAPQTSASPYTVSFTSSSYVPGKPITVMLNGTGGTTFKGFMIQARLAGGQNQSLIGSFTPVNNAALACSGKALTHNNNNTKSSIEFTWSPPALATGDIVFRVTFVQNGATYWVNQPSTILSDASMLKKDSECGKTKGCLSECNATNCLFTLNWKAVDNNVIYVLSTTYKNSVGSYMAVGLSDDHKMGNDSVLGCANQGTSFKVFTAKTEGATTPVQHVDADVKLTNYTNENGIFTCTISRPIAGTALRYDFSKSWVVFFVVGQAAVSSTGNVTIEYHMENDFMTDVRVNVTSMVDLAPHEIEDQMPMLKKDSECGKTKGCLSECNATNCLFTLNWKAVDNNVIYVLSTTYKNSVGSYMAVGLSDDHKMGNDSVLGCANQGTSFKVFTAKTEGATTPVQHVDVDVKLTNYSNENGIFTCTISRPIAGTALRYDFSKSWVVFFVVGPASVSSTGNVTIESHMENDFMTDVRVNVTSMVDLKPNEIEDKKKNSGNQIKVDLLIQAFVTFVIMAASSVL